MLDRLAILYFALCILIISYGIVAAVGWLVTGLIDYFLNL